MPKKQLSKLPKPAPLVFVDTNKLLDFYRFDNDAGPSLLSKLEQLNGRLIMTYQIEMEFKKNRQKIMIDSLKELKNTDSNIKASRFLADAKALQGINTNKIKINAQISKLHSQLDQAIKNPRSKDPVYQSLQRLFQLDSPYNLGREHGLRFEMRRLARKRFALGYPPRKSSDTSIGDSVNWEWIVHCGAQCKSDVIIITRDSDFGETHRGESFPNDWLSQEFQERVGKGKKIYLHTRLTDGLKAASIKTTPDEATAESSVEASRATAAAVTRDRPNPGSEIDDLLKSFMLALADRTGESWTRLADTLLERPKSQD